MLSASGDQYQLEFASTKGLFRATIAQVGASLRAMSVDDIDLVIGYEIDEPAPLCAGIVMAPWPNRIDGGKWQYQGKTLEVDITIHSQQNANHGFLGRYPFRLVAQEASSVTLGATIFPREGYPFLLELEVTYRLSEDGLEVAHRAVNHSSAAAPYAIGGHAYFQFSTTATEDLIIRNEAKTFVKCDERQIPIEWVPTPTDQYNLVEGVRIGDHFFDDDFSELVRDAAGRAHTYLTGNDGRGLDVWQDEKFDHVVLFTPSFFPTKNGPVYAAAIEPQTAAPNAFNNGDGLTWIEPNAQFSASWGVALVGFN
jgi:aldose 1-epimerase